MEIHTCKNCIDIEDVLSEKLKWFALLSAENISLHTNLASAREDNETLLKKIAGLRSMSINDQDEIVKLFVEVETSKMSANKNAIGSSTEDEAADDIRKMFVLLDTQKKIHEEQMKIILQEKVVLMAAYDRKHNKLQDHIKILLEELDLCRQQIFRQAKQNLIEKRLFRDVIDDLKTENKRAIDRISKGTLCMTYDKAKSRVIDVLRTKDEQLKRQDDLIAVLRCQQDALNSQIQDIIKSKDTLIKQFQAKILKAKQDFKRVQHNYSALERRRQLDAEGFQTDVTLLRKDLKRLGKPSKSTLKESFETYSNKLNELEDNIAVSYSN